MTRQAETSALLAGYLNCHSCGLLHRYVQHPRLRCRRCNSSLHMRTPHGLGKAWLLSLLAAICLIPAHMLPIMTVVYFGSGEPNTILSGVIALVHHKMYPIALVVFIASVVVPFFKLIALWSLLLSIHSSRPRHAAQRTWLYRIVEGIGKWSMVDVFVIALLMALVDMGQIATIQAGHGATAFCLSVVLTMVAAQSFDPRLMWDFQRSSND